MAPAAVAVSPNVGSMQEILFAQRLADNDKKVRDRTLKKLRRYLSVKSNAGRGFSDEDALKIWKGLFYCMYMADKPLTQEDLAEDISALFHVFNNEEAACCFMRAAFVTFAREWNGIDVFRIDKYMMFIRRLLRQVFVYLRDRKWPWKEVILLTEVLETTVVCPEDEVNATPMGLKLHVCSIILEELGKIGGEELEHRIIVAILQPYFKVLALSKQGVYLKNVSEEIIRHLMRQSEVGVKHELGPVSTEDVENEEIADIEQDDVEQDDGSGEEDSVLDPRAGHVDAYIPQLKPDFNLLADALQSVGATSRVRKVNRQRIYQLVGELRDVGQGSYPLAVPDEYVDDDIEVPDSEVEKAVERMQKFQENLGKPNQAKDDDLDMRPAKTHLSKKKKLAKKKKLLAVKKSKQQKRKGLSKKEKKRLDNHERELALKRKRAVENKLKLVAAAAGIPKSIIPISNSLTGRKPKEAHGFKVCPVIQKSKRPTDMSSGGKNGFLVETIESEISGKKRKIREAAEKPVKKKMCSFTVTDLNLPSKVELSNAQKSVRKGETYKFSVEQTKKKPDTRLSDGNLCRKYSKDEVVNNIALDRDEPVKENGRSEPEAGDKSLTCFASEQVGTRDNSDTAVIPCTTNVGSIFPSSSDKTTTSDGSDKKVTERLIILGDSKDKDVTEKLGTSGKNEKTASKGLTTPETSNKAKSDKIASPEINLIGDTGNNNKASASNTSDATVNENLTTTGKTNKAVSVKMASPKTNLTGDAGLVINFSEKDNQKGFEDRKRTSQKSPWDDPLQEGEIEIFIKSKRQMKRDKKKKRESAKKLSKISSQKARTISINLRENKEHDYSDYARTLKASPRIPFNASLLPKAPVLKPSPSPILVKKPVLKKLRLLTSTSSPQFRNGKKRAGAADFF